MEARSMGAAIMAALLPVLMGARFETPNFVVETPDAQLAQEIGRAAEKFRRDLAVSWLGKAMPDWSRQCPMTVRVGPRLGAGGATSFVFDRGEVFGWRMTIQGSRERLLDSVLPHEITHMVLASHFRSAVPRWADEGAATSVEHKSERFKHRKMLIQFLRTGHGIDFRRMFAMKQYPADIMPLYAQGYSTADFLIQQGGRRKFVKFLGEGMQTGRWSQAIENHYELTDLPGLQDQWLAWVREGSPAIEQPATQPATGMIADTGRRPRPEPNLIYREPPSYAPGSVISVGASGFFSPIQEAEPAMLTVVEPATAKPLSADGWRASGSTVKAVPRAKANPSSAPVRSQPARPQSFEQPRQIILDPFAPRR